MIFLNTVTRVLFENPTHCKFCILLCKKMFFVKFLGGKHVSKSLLSVPYSWFSAQRSPFAFVSRSTRARAHTSSLLSFSFLSVRFLLLGVWESSAGSLGRWCGFVLEQSHCDARRYVKALAPCRMCLRYRSMGAMPPPSDGAL